MTSPFLGFWKNLCQPIIALAPMDGVTDFACRAIMARHGRPHVLFTEFTTAEGLFYAPERILNDFRYSEIERPVVAQIYGHDPDDFYKATHVVCELGFDGVDINMGCPSKKVVEKNCGAKLITAPDLAIEIIKAVRHAIQDWSRGQTLEELKLSERVIATVCRMNSARIGAERLVVRRPIPYSIKTRIGYDAIIIDRWVETLLQQSPAVISIHGRTLKQMYRGLAHWEAIAEAVAVARGSGTLILGNGDIESLTQATSLIQKTGVNGVLIGRSAIGNPWLFQGIDPLNISYERRAMVALEHASLYAEAGDDLRKVRKHLSGYLRYFPEASSVRNQALQAVNLEELASILPKSLKSPSRIVSGCGGQPGM
ncbi:MAG: tRNA-dihydrouridine synthase [Deltaproteobacteria bacterium]|nr:tRNA-dihydrouridine synthase [Deltaproteobacteria bacterium]